MKRLLSAIACVAMLQFAVAPQVKAVEAAPKYCWATFKMVAGIAVCNGAANDCTKPCTTTTQPSDTTVS